MAAKKSVVTIKIEVPCYSATAALKHAQKIVDTVSGMNPISQPYVVKAAGVTGA